MLLSTILPAIECLLIIIIIIIMTVIILLKVIKIEVDNTLECKDLTVKRKNKSDTNNNRANWSHFKIVRKIPEQLTGKAQHQAILGTGHIPRIVLM
jgi:predicted Holliday junction resolvase-like endonuclease